METFQILSDQFSHFQHLFHRWLAIFCIISSYIFDLSSSPHTWGIRGRILSIVFLPVHPHLCWAYPSLHLAAISQNGSSPHTWGIHPWIAEQVNARRFIPTYVGHTVTQRYRDTPSSVHPHIRGAYSNPPVQGYTLIGSSPPTWGIRRGRASTAYSYGSSPPTWGIQRLQISTGQLLRFIPTYVGHTRHRPRPAVSAPVHPHLRGAYTGPP